MSSSYPYRSLGLPGQASCTSELFRSDLITAMKLPDSHHLEPTNYVEIREQWRSEWEIGVQVCVNPDSLPEISLRLLSSDEGETTSSESFLMPVSLCPDEVNDTLSQEEVLSRGCYEIDELDIAWLEQVNEKRKYKVLAGTNGLTEEQLQNAILTLEKKCYQNMMRAVATEESLKIEYDHSIVCDVCKDPDREDKNEMVFCDSCNVCVHQACYGIQIIPKGSWMCRPCSIQQSQLVACVLCSTRGGAMKRVKPGPGWAHMTCALWIPEVKIANVDKMEPVTNIESIPLNRWSLLCCICRERKGACIQCSYPTCVASYHVTCGFKSGLEMKSLLSTTGNAVKHESYCPRHTTLRKTPSKLLSPVSQELTPLERVEQQFYEYSSPEDLTSELKLPSQLSSLIYNYWKLKRKCRHNQPLLLGLHLDLSYQRLQAGRHNSELQISPLTDEHFLNIVHLRHNLEKARNLLYMVQRRERLKLLSLRSAEELTRFDLRQIEQNTKETKQPLCLKRLGIDLTTPTTRLENGLGASSNGSGDNHTHDRLTGAEVRMLRKRAASRSEIDDAPSITPTHQCGRASESGCGNNISSTGTFCKKSSAAGKSSRSTESILC